MPVDAAESTTQDRLWRYHIPVKRDEAAPTPGDSRAGAGRSNHPQHTMSVTAAAGYGSVRIRAIDLGDLRSFAQEVLDHPEVYGVTPIVPVRASAHAANPVADPSDVSLLVAYQGDRCIGYLGFLPVLVADRGARRRTVCLSSFYVAPEARNTGAGIQLITRAMSLLPHFFVSGASAKAGRLYQGLRMKVAGPLTFYRFRLDAAAPFSHALKRLQDAAQRLHRPALASMTQHLRRLAGAVERPTRAVLPRLLALSLRRRSTGVGFAAVTGLRSDNRLSAKLSSSYFPRDPAVINWMIEKPWITESPEDQRERPLDYAFSHRRELFRFLPFALTRDEEPLAEAVFSISRIGSRTKLKVLDVRVQDAVAAHPVMLLALQLALRWDADVLECGEPYAAVLLSTHLGRALAQRCERRYYFYSSDSAGLFAARTHELRLDYCDGEQAFT
jgi:GNAT superfamily N-acetyltransferase